MMDFSEKWGKDVDEAVTLALRDLKVTIDEVEVKVLEEPSKGFLGIGSKLAKVRVELKSKGEEKETIEKKEETKSFGSGEKPVGKPRREKRPPKKEKREHKEEEPLSQEIRRTSVNIKPDDLKPVEEHVALDFLKSTAEKMKLELSFSAEENPENLYIEIEGKDAGTIIGKRGQTLDAIQYLTSLVVNKDKEDYVRVVIDAENYREKREKTLEKLADRLAGKVIKTRRSVRLEPMNPYERMVIHAALHNHSKVKTRSEGEEPYRRVIIELK